jgi:hypothetical protein
MFVPKFAAPAARMTGLQWSYGPAGQAEWLTPEIPPATKILPLYRMLCYFVLQWIYMDLLTIYIYNYIYITYIYKYWSCRISAIDGSCHMFMFEATGKKDEPLDPHWQVKRGLEF